MQEKSLAVHACTPTNQTHLNAQSLVDRQDLEQEGQVSLFLEVPEVVRVGFQELDQEDTGVAFFRPLREVAGLRHDPAGAVGVGAHPQLGVHLVLLRLEALVLHHLELGDHAVLAPLAPGIVLDSTIQSPHDDGIRRDLGSEEIKGASPPAAR